MKTQILEQVGLNGFAILLIAIAAAGAVAAAIVVYLESRQKKEHRDYEGAFATAVTSLILMVLVSAIALGQGGFYKYAGTVKVSAVESQGEGGRLIEIEGSDQTFYLSSKTTKIVRVGDTLDLECWGNTERGCGAVTK